MDEHEEEKGLDELDFPGNKGKGDKALGDDFDDEVESLDALADADDEAEDPFDDEDNEGFPDEEEETEPEW
jgi:hypothetical protein